MPRTKRDLHQPELGLPEVRKLWQTEGLFSDHYLKARIHKNSWWPTDDQARPIWQFCKELYERRYIACAKNNEAFTRQELLDKILEKLGFACTDNLGLPDQDAEPDYILFANAAEKEAVIDKPTAHRYRAAAAILEAKKLHHPLSQISKHQQRYPHQQIRDYLNEAQVLTWGILTNGNEWRLYCRDAKPSAFFSINFEVAIESLENFKFFLALFGPDAFVRDTQGKCRLDHVRESALAAQSELEEDLRLRIFSLVELLANGFAERAENQIADTDEDRKRLYNNCLIFLYRLLFILYAEGRELLPVEPKTRKYYKELSLARLRAPLKNFSEYDSRTRTRLYEDIRELCHLINGTDEAKNKEYSVPRYNGGLFDPNQHPELEQWRVCDAVLADVLRGLLFNPPPKRDQPTLPIETVDYADLRVQQLGSIYEGLLEHHFVRENGRLVLKTDKAERKATGTYYTPDYIVKYIVEHTLGPLLADIEQSKEVQAAKKANRQDNSFAEAVLRLNICDPAMGSGHFLVEATNYLAEHIVYHPTTKFQAKFVKGESQEQAEIAYWRRRVVEACIYGVDLNPLAVELAKLSLWLTTIATDQPLNFLDHHLRCGNSLIGARLDQLGSVPAKKAKRQPPGAPSQIQFTFGPDLKRAVANAIREIHAIEARPSTDVASVKDKEAHWRDKVLPALAPYKAVADLWTSTFFGNPLDNETYVSLAVSLSEAKGLSGSGPSATPEILRSAQNDKWRETAAARRFFHWELEFPEVFFHEDGSHKENPGFDAVIGNPPYGAELSEQDQTFIKSHFPLSRRNTDTALVFLEQAFVMMQKQGHCGMIVPKSIAYVESWQCLRPLFLPSLRIFADASKAFEGVLLEQVVLIAGGRPQPTYCAVGLSKAATDFETEIAKNDCEIIGRLLCDVSAKDREIFERIAACSILFQELFDSFEGGHWYSELKESGKIPVYHSRYLQRYYLREPQAFLESPPATDMRKFQKMQGPKLLFQRLVAHIMNPKPHLEIACYYDSEGIIPLKTIEVCLPKESNYSPQYSLALCNSLLLSYFAYKFIFASAIRGMDFDAAYVGRLPIRRIAFTTPATERKRHVAKARELYERCLTRDDAGDVLEFVEKQLREGRADVIHDLLAFLAERMMALNKDKQTVAKQFLTDLKDFHGIDAHALKPKTKLDEFWKLDAAELFAHFRANRLRLSASDEEKIRARFQKAQDKLVPLDSQIEFTDRLIDQIVYRLYGLTAEEIKIVEEGVK